MTREEEFYAAILAAINGDDHTCPTPVWRIEEFLKAIHDAIANGGGGGSSGGGVLVVHMVYNEQLDNEYTDKTWKEIHDAPVAVVVSEDIFGVVTSLVTWVNRNPEDNKYYVTSLSAVSVGEGATVGILVTDSENGYLTWAD